MPFPVARAARASGFLALASLLGLGLSSPASVAALDPQGSPDSSHESLSGLHPSATPASPRVLGCIRKKCDTEPLQSYNNRFGCIGETDVVVEQGGCLPLELESDAGGQGQAKLDWERHYLGCWFEQRGVWEDLPAECSQNEGKAYAACAKFVLGKCGRDPSDPASGAGVIGVDPFPLPLAAVADGSSDSAEQTEKPGEIIFV